MGSVDNLYSASLGLLAETRSHLLKNNGRLASSGGTKMMPVLDGDEMPVPDVLQVDKDVCERLISLVHGLWDCIALPPCLRFTNPEGFA